MERITTREAARRLGISSTQVRRRIAAGDLRAETERRPQGTRLVVLWDAAPDAPSHAPGTSHDAPSTPHDAPSTHPDAPPGERGLVASLEAQVAWLQERLEQAEVERAELRRMLLFEQQTVATLRQTLLPGASAPAAPKGAPGPPQEPAHAAQTRPPGYIDRLRRWLRG